MSSFDTRVTVDKDIDIDIDFDWDKDVDIYVDIHKDIDVDVDLDQYVDLQGNFANLLGDFEAIGDDTFVEVEASVLTTDYLSSVTLDVISAVD